MKKYLVFLLAIMFAACSTTHKSKTVTDTKVDSVVSTTKDSSTVAKAQTYNDNFVAKGVDITFDYNNDDSTDSGANVNPSSVTPSITTKDGTAVSNVIKNALTGQNFVGRIPSSVTIHIDSLGNSTTTSSTVDSTTSKSTVKADVKTKVDTKTKDVTRTGMSGWLWLIIGVVVLGALVWVAFKFKLI